MNLNVPRIANVLAPRYRRIAFSQGIAYSLEPAGLAVSREYAIPLEKAILRYLGASTFAIRGTFRFTADRLPAGIPRMTVIKVYPEGSIVAKKVSAEKFCFPDVHGFVPIF